MTKLLPSAVIADDHELVRGALQQAMAGDYDIVACVEDGLSALAAVKQAKPDLLILDVTMPMASGAQVLHDIHRWSPQTRIAVLTGVESSAVLRNLLADGAHGIFAKSDPLDDLLQALPVLLSGGHYVAPRLEQLMETENAFTSLTSRERQTVNMIIAGKTNKEIAEALSVSPKTVDKHRTSLMKKLNVHSVVELMALALRQGLIEPMD